MGLVDCFWEESDPQLRRLLLDEAGGRNSGATTFEFDVFDVELDFDSRTVVVVDVLGNRSRETTSMDSFLAKAASYGDDPSVGDGLTEMQRRPPFFRVTANGTTEKISDSSR